MYFVECIDSKSNTYMTININHITTVRKSIIDKDLTIIGTTDGQEFSVKTSYSNFAGLLASISKNSVSI